MDWPYANFSKQEVECKCGCGLLPTAQFMEKLQLLRGRFGKPIQVTSGARCQSYNMKVGGSGNSQHIKGVAVDIAVVGNMKWDLAHNAFILGFHGIGVSKTFLHLDIRPFQERVIWQYGV